MWTREYCWGRAVVQGVLLFALLIANAVAEPTRGGGDGKPPSRPPPKWPMVGINMPESARDWQVSYLYNDLMKHARVPESQSKGLVFDELGNIVKVKRGAVLKQPLVLSRDPFFPGGAYTVTFDGEAELVLTNAELISKKPGKEIWWLPQGVPDQVWLNASNINPKNPIRNIKVHNGKPGVFLPEYIQFLKPFGVLRSMTMQHVSYSEVSDWEKRGNRPDDPTYSKPGGDPIELITELANLVGSDLWISVPHRATDDYVKQMATYLRDNAEGKIYLELSNEPWNSIFKQTGYFKEQGTKLKLREKPWEAGWAFYARRAVEVFQIFEEVFGGRERLVRVLAGQAANSWISKFMLEQAQAAVPKGHPLPVDAFAIAPYFTVGKGDYERVRDMKLDELFELIEKEKLPRAREMMVENKKVTDKYGIRLLAYEGGQHLVGVGDEQLNDEKLTKLFVEANADPRMGDLTRKHLEDWREVVDDVYCYFLAPSARPGRFGSWGIKESIFQPDKDAPKLQGVIEFVQNYPQPEAESQSPAKKADVK